jgi:hypothetical protein
VTTVDHKVRHVWARTPTGICCAYMFSTARPEPAAIAKLETEEAQRRAMRIDVRWTH